MVGVIKYSPRARSLILEKREFTKEEAEQKELLAKIDTETPLIKFVKSISAASTISQVKKAACDFLENNNIKIEKGE